ncbi:glycosyltransferase involved in cell wall biosynthesis [Paraburkholderia sp. GAS41]|uniref:glycosyltransferase family 4 protein n=1 Tax=Paraburkholderia sp. GAS41 TaxID=3035134 RepID=UPI003D1A0726
MIQRIFKLAKTLYLSVFMSVAYRAMRHKRKDLTSERSPGSIKIVCRYGLKNGLANGAVYNGLALETLGYAVEQPDVTAAMRNPFKTIFCRKGGLFIFHCAAPQFLLLAWPLRRLIRSGKTIGYFAWELAEPPRDWPKYKDVWDEIWTPSRFSAQSLAKLYDCPIRVVPHVLLEKGSPRGWRKGEEALTFLTMADARSSLARKNPRAAVEAFRRAFPNEWDVSLVIKLQANQASEEVNTLLSEAEDDPRICIIQETMTRAEVDRLFSDAHVYVSLHRAEGFGLPLLEARLFGLATLATAWSGNLDFMSEEDSVLIPCELATMRDEGGVYGEVTWAEPDVDAAALAMRRFYEDPAYLARIAKAGWEASSPERQLARLAEALRIPDEPLMLDAST